MAKPMTECHDDRLIDVELNASVVHVGMVNLLLMSMISWHSVLQHFYFSPLIGLQCQ